MTDAFRCDGCGDYYDQGLRTVTVGFDLQPFVNGGYTLDDLPYGAYDILTDDRDADLCPDCGMEAIDLLTDAFRGEKYDDGGEDTPDHE